MANTVFRVHAGDFLRGKVHFLKNNQLHMKVKGSFRREKISTLEIIEFDTAIAEGRDYFFDKNKEVMFSCKLKDGRSFIASAPTDVYQLMLAAEFNGDLAKSRQVDRTVAFDKGAPFVLGMLALMFLGVKWFEGQENLETAQQAGFVSYHDYSAAKGLGIQSPQKYAEYATAEKVKKELNAAIQRRKKAEAEAEKAATGDSNGAWAYMQLFVMKQLKSPKGATFAGARERVVSPLGAGRYSVYAYVDSQNGFGANIRTRFNGVIVDLDGSWRLESLEFE